jgi:hypothetical protein
MTALIMANARRNVDSSAGPRAAPRPASTSAPASAAHCPIAANDRSARALPATRGHAGHFTRCHDTAGHNLTS